MNTKKFTLFITALFTTLLFAACGDKVDQTLDKAENVISKYESKAKDKTLTKEDLKDMHKQIEDINEDFKINVGKETALWEVKQRERSVRLIARMEKLEQSIYRSDAPF